jgi:hypothetical protein
MGEIDQPESLKVLSNKDLGLIQQTLYTECGGQDCFGDRQLIRGLSSKQHTGKGLNLWL